MYKVTYKHFSSQQNNRRAGRWAWSIALATTTAIACLPASDILAASIQPNRRTSPASDRIILALSWGDILKPLRRERRAGISRGGICLIAPSVMGETTVVQNEGTPAAVNRTPEVWSDRPLFLWKGRAVRIELRSYDTKEVMWNQAIPPEATQVTYARKPLQLGQTYEGEIIDHLNGRNPFTFKVMGAEQRDRIAAELTALEASLKDKGSTAEQIALQRANYFAQNQLWSDVLQAAFSVKNPSAELNDLICQTPAQFCGSPASRNLTP